MPIRWRALFIVALSVGAAASTITSPALAVQPDTPADPKRRADALMKEGLDLDKAGKAEPALAKFEEAFGLMPASGVLVYHVARVEQGLGRVGSALGHYRDAVRDPGLPPDLRRDAERAIEELKARMSAITLDVPAGATTTVDGNPVDSASAIELVPGKHVVKIRLADDTKSLEVLTRAGSVTPVKLRFGETEPPPATEPATPNTEGNGEGEPPRKDEASPGLLTTRNVVGGSLAILGLAALGTGFGFLLDSSGRVTDARAFNRGVPGGACDVRATASCDHYAAMLDDAESSRTVSTIAFIGGGALGAASFAVFALWPSGDKGTSGALVRPVVTSNTLGVRGVF